MIDRETSPETLLIRSARSAGSIAMSPTRIFGASSSSKITSMKMMTTSSTAVKVALPNRSTGPDRFCAYDVSFGSFFCSQDCRCSRFSSWPIHPLPCSAF